ncbi:MAG: TAXI family TRAP transporter solute-binding subunit [Planctomycetota bacterium]
MMFRIALPLALGATLSLFGAGCGKSGSGDVRFVTIGTGGITGVYYPTGGAISKMVNGKKDVYGLSCSVQSTGGSVFNVNAIMAGDMEFGIVQSDRQYQAVRGLAEWKQKGPQADLRAVFSIHPETVTLVAADDAGIETIGDLAGKRVNIGNPGSGQRQNAIDALENAGIDREKDIRAESVRASEAPGLLQDDRIDAFFYTVGHPSGAIKEATAGVRKVHFVPITGTDTLLRRLPYYAMAKIHVRHYPSATNKKDVETFGVKATLMTSTKVPDDVVYAICREVFENLDAFKELHPAYSDLTRENMLEGLTAPIHPGAMRYYREAGLK